MGCVGTACSAVERGECDTAPVHAEVLLYPMRTAVTRAKCVNYTVTPRSASKGSGGLHASMQVTLVITNVALNRNFRSRVPFVVNTQKTFNCWVENF